MVPAQVTCRFAGSGFDAARRDLVPCVRGSGEIGAGTLYFLKRFWLGTADAVTHDPGHAPALACAAGAVRRRLWRAADARRLPSAAVYALIAASYALVYGLIGRIMLGFGEVAALGSIAAVVSVATSLTLDPVTPVTAIILAIIVAVLVSALHGHAAGVVVLATAEAWQRPADADRDRRALAGAFRNICGLRRATRRAGCRRSRTRPCRSQRPARSSPAFRSASLAITSLGLAACAIVSGTSPCRASGATGGRWPMMRAWPVCWGRLRGRVPARDRARLRPLGAGRPDHHGDLRRHGLCGRDGHRPERARRAVLGVSAPCAAPCWADWQLPPSRRSGRRALPIEHRDLVIYALLAVVLIVPPGGFFGEPALTPRQI